MGVKRHFWRIASTVTVGFVVIAFVFAAYNFHWSVTGFSNKTLWDWMQLLIISFALAAFAIWVNRVEKKNDQAIASDNMVVPKVRFIRSFRAQELQPCFVNRKREENK